MHTHTQTRTHVQGRRERVRKRVRRVTFVPTCRESAGQSKVSSTLITLDTGFHFVLGLSVAVVPTCVCVCVFMGHHCYCLCLTVSGYPCLPVTRPVATCSILMIFSKYRMYISLRISVYIELSVNEDDWSAT